MNMNGSFNNTVLSKAGSLVLTMGIVSISFSGLFAPVTAFADDGENDHNNNSHYHHNHHRHEGDESQAPVAVADAYGTSEGTTLSVDETSGVLANDTSDASTTLSAVLVTTTTSGLLTLNPDGSFTYIPNADFSGTDSFTYKANDGSQDSNTVTVTITVSPVDETPITAPDTYSTNKNQTLTVAAPGVTSNDTDTDLDADIHVTLDDTTTNGVLTLNGDGSFTYVPDTGFSGTDSFTYTAQDGDSVSSETYVTITVNPNQEEGTTADLAVSKTVDNAQASAGATVTYTITVSNNSGPDTATNVMVTDILPAGVTYISDDSTTTGTTYATSTGVWSVGSLSVESSKTLHIVASVNNADTAGQVITNTASVSSDATDSNSENNSGSATITIPTPETPPGGGGGDGGNGGNGGGGNGPIVGSFGGGNGPIVGSIGGSGGQVLGASTTTVPNSCTKYLTSFIRTGANNDKDQVTRLQNFLNQFEGATLTVNGIYDAPTLAALKAFQGKYGVDVLTPWGSKAPTGFVYLTTRKEVNTIYCHFTQNFPLSANEQAIVDAYRSGNHSGSGSSDGHHTTVHTDVLPTTGSSDTDSTSTTNQTGAAGASTGGLFNFLGHLFGH
jgi:uncharacterized repeat protein (TIGR01451 family)